MPIRNDHNVTTRIGKHVQDNEPMSAARKESNSLVILFLLDVAEKTTVLFRH